MQKRYLLPLAIFINLLLSYLMLLYNQPINSDGILYINTAKAFLAGGFHSASGTYNWPFYSIILAEFVSLSHLSFLASGFILNSLFTSMLIVFFILSSELLENTSKVLPWAAAIILLFPELNHDRYNILRDIPYYALFIFSLWSYLKYIQTEKFSYAVLWQIAILSATLFRIEGAVFLLATPLLTFLIPAYSITQKFMRALKLYSLTIVLGVSGIILFSHFLNFGRIPELFSYLNPNELFNVFQTQSNALKPAIGVLGQNNSGIFLIGGLISVFAHSFLTTLGISSFLLIYGIYAKLLPQNKSAIYSLIIYIFINLAVLLAFSLHNLFMNWRYTVPLVLTCLLFVPGMVEKLPKTGIKILFCLYLAAASFIPFGTSNAYLVKAGQWIDLNTPSDTIIYSNSDLLIFYADRTAVTNPKKADYVLIQSKILSPTALPKNQLPVINFKNRRGDGAYIFKK
ncbi:MAG: hypothetical protein SFW07_01835 [Gammaproteobacteria bacterium]|nr:hypothetical protein [Gammaproteobacteria bacterium]